ncbi:hypothetical protein [Cecembia lonarensis]|uniref:Uncharacterized protein n=1 Tax=Cecembia lonarensis (strain CCUG 58316 / KCTC 22772 / LW9) TaxID=1225176 RepID=K1L7W6_CECL9|nr:hypothetical protein [Cecembia lonarensis]EKB48202.1 hypothetical protein B879_03201 [Cecembia lonarensis LW9]
MTDRTFIEDQDLVEKMLKKLTPLNESSGWQCELFIDKTTNQKWEKYQFELLEADNDGIGLRRFPYPSTKEIIRIALTSKYFDEIDGASGLLLDMEFDKVEFREMLISEIEKNINNIDKDRFEIIYNRAELYETLNKREVLGKHYKQIEKDAEYFKELMAKAEGLRQRLKQIKK